MVRPVRRRGGFSLLEMVVAMALLAIVLDILYQLLVPGLRVWMNGSARAELQQSGVVATNWLAQEFTTSTGDSVVIEHLQYTDPSGQTRSCDTLSFYSPFDDSHQVQYQPPLGTLLWQKRVIYYMDTAKHLLCRQEQPLTPATTDPTNPPVPVVGSPAVFSTRILTRNVWSLAFDAATRTTTDNRTVPANPVHMSLLLYNPDLNNLYTAEAAFSALFTDT